MIFLYGGPVLLRGEIGELRDRQPGMMTLISLAIVVAFATSWAVTIGIFEMVSTWLRDHAWPRCTRAGRRA